MSPASDTEEDVTARKRWLGLLAKAPHARLLALTEALSAPHEVLRAPEIGAVMVRGRAGGTGAAFNLGEMSVTRCSARLTEGPVGHGYVQGRSKEAALRAALVDAMMQTGAAGRIEAEVLKPLAAEAEVRARYRAEKAAATKVDFFTLVRGEA